MPPHLRNMIEELIATPSISSVNPAFDSSNAAVCHKLAPWLEDLGFLVSVEAVPGTPDKFNLVATRGNGPGGLILAGHTDTVPYDEGRWQHDPFGADERDGRIYGLGSADMKSFFALAIEAIRQTLDSDPRRPLTVLATADEESSMSGARALAAREGLPAECAVIGEPTGLRPVRAHKGILMEAVKLTGQAAHSSNPGLGNNAIDGMHRVIAALMELREELARKNHDDRFEVAHPTLNLGHVRGGDNANRVCGACELHYDLRLLPGMDLETTRQTLRERIAAAVGGTGLTLEHNALFEGVAGFDTGADSALLAACVEHTGNDPAIVGFATEAPFLAGLGLDTVVIGPGDIDQAHRPDEYLPLASLQPAVELFSHLIHRYCRA